MKSIVTDLLMKELDTNTSDAVKHLEVILNMHKEVINAEHPEFTKMRKLKEKEGVRFKNHFNVWFQEEINLDPSNVSQGRLSYINLKELFDHMFNY